MLSKLLEINSSEVDDVGFSDEPSILQSGLSCSPHDLESNSLRYSSFVFA
jgi:hypothetical protein